MRTALAGAAALVLLAAGCGGGDGNDFREQADAICADYQERIDAVEVPSSLQELAGSAAEVAGLIEDGTAELAELEPPDDLEDAYGDWIGLNEQGAARLREISAAAEQDDQARVQELAGLADRNEREADARAEELGLEDCAADEGDEVTDR